MRISAARARLLLLLITLAAFGLRVYQLEAAPPGWSDDELSNVLVIAQKPLQGDYSVYYTDATGLEALYHAASAIPLALFGFNALGIRLLSAFLGTLTVPLTYQVARRLFRNRLIALVAAAALAVSFWSLIYSRVNLRHISAPLFMLLAFYFFLAGLQSPAPDDRDRAAASKWQSAGRRNYVAAGIFLGLGFYTYFAARGTPLILAAFCLYLGLFHRPVFRRHWRGFALMFGLALLIAIPLAVTLRGASGADARVAEVAAPLIEALDGDFTLLQEHVAGTLRMFDANGDSEFLYNIPHRPVFKALTALLFWGGVLTAIVYAVRPFRRRAAGPDAATNQLGATFLLLWWFAGIFPGFLSVPAGSLGHTILAQSAAYILLALPLLPFQGWTARNRRLAALVPLGGVLLLTLVAGRDLPDYFLRWPAQGNVRFLYRADIREVAGYLQANPSLVDAGISSLLSGPWDRLALEIDLGRDPLAGSDNDAPHLRWYDPRRAILLETGGEPAVVLAGYPVVETVYDELYHWLEGETAGGYSLAEVAGDYPLLDAEICFENGLCLAGYHFDRESGSLDLLWRVAERLQLPQSELVSKPPPPDVYDGLRLAVFAQLLDGQGDFLVGDDGLWVDPTTLRAGDLFMQQHRLLPISSADDRRVLVGLYDPFTGQRILTTAGQDSVELEPD